VKEGVIGKGFSRHGRDEKAYKISVRRPEGNLSLGRL
jgi:hypothetical protein